MSSTKSDHLKKPAVRQRGPGSPKGSLKLSPKMNAKRKKTASGGSKGPSNSSVVLALLVFASIGPMICYIMNILSWPASTVTKKNVAVYRYDAEADPIRKKDHVMNSVNEWTYDSHYYDVDSDETGFKLAYIDEGPGEEGTPCVLLLHDAPLWSYTFRTLLPSLSMSQVRVIAVDLIGFGKSDKPKELKYHTLENHSKYIKELLTTHLKLKNVTVIATGRSTLLAHVMMVSDKDNVFNGAVYGNPLMLKPNSDGDGDGDGKNKLFSESLAKVPALPFSYMIENFLAHYSPYLSVLITMKNNIDPYYSKVTIVELSTMETPLEHNAYCVGWAGVSSWPYVSSDKYYSAYLSLDKPILILTTKEDEISNEVAEWMKEFVPGVKKDFLKHEQYEKGSTYIQEDRAVEMAENIKKFITMIQTET